MKVRYHELRIRTRDYGARVFKRWFPQFFAVYAAVMVWSVLWIYIEYSWWWGIGITIGVCIVLWKWLSLLEKLVAEKTLPQFSPWALVGTIAVAALLGSAVSYLINQKLPGTYVATEGAAARLTLAAFIKYYFIVALDLIPGLHLSETLKLKPILTYQDPGAGLPVLAFKALLLFKIVKIIRPFISSTSGP